MVRRQIAKYKVFLDGKHCDEAIKKNTIAVKIIVWSTELITEMQIN